MIKDLDVVSSSTNSTISSTEPEIIIYRQYITHNLVNARIMEITAKYYLWIPKGAEIWIYELPGYLPNLEAITSDNVSLPILSDDELNILFGSKKSEIVTQEGLRELYNERYGNKKRKETTDPHYVGIMIPPLDYTHFEEITLKWTEQVDNKEKSKYKISQIIERHQIVQPTTEASTYVHITMDNKKYELRGKPQLEADDANCVKTDIQKDELKELIRDKTQCVYRIKRHCDKTFKITWTIGIPFMVSLWTWTGFLISLSVIGFSIVNFIHDKTTLDIDEKLLAGLIALMIGFRVILFHDIDLMDKWNRLYLALLVVDVLCLLVMYGLTSFKLTG